MTSLTEVAGVVHTDAGATALWNAPAFAAITAYDSWERELLEDEDLDRHIAAGHLVPITRGSDGVFNIVARVGNAATRAQLTDRENQFCLVATQTYPFEATGTVLLSGIEFVEGNSTSAFRVPLETGKWDVVVNLIEWDAERGARGADGKPVASALPDFVLLINPGR